MNTQDPITKLAMTPRTQKEAGIHYLEWADDSIKNAAKVLATIFGLMVFATLLAVSV